MADYDNTHRSLLQVFMAKGTLTYASAKPILASILSAHDTSRNTLPDDITPQDFSDYITALNGAVSPYDLEIRSTIPQAPLPPAAGAPNANANAAPDRVYALVNTTSDPITQLATTRSADEIAFLRRVLDAMFETYNTRRAEVFAVTSMQALDLARGVPRQSLGGTQGEGAAAGATGLTKAEAERCLESLKEEGWFDLSRKGYYRLSARALMELRQWLVDTYNEGRREEGASEDEDEERVERIRFCHGCREIVIVGQRCDDRDCPVRMHDFCARNVLRVNGNKCPVCKKGWSGDGLVGERAAVRGRASGTSAGRQSNGVVDHDDDDDA